MLSDVGSQKIAKYRKLAKKNTFCRYLVMSLVVMNVIVVKFFAFNKRCFRAIGQVCIVAGVLFINTSFAPPTFATVSMDVTVVEEAEEALSYTNQKSIEETQDGHSTAGKEDAASLDDLIEKNNTTVVENSKYVSETEQSQGVSEEAGSLGVGTDVVFDKDSWNLLLINKQHMIPEDYEFTLGTIKGTMRCDERIIEPLTQMFAAAKAAGINLVVRSPYRDMERQEYLFERKVKNFQMAGMSYMDAYKKASFTVTVPGASEHQVGLAVDITSDTYPVLQTGFADTVGGKWLAVHSWEYGFILRYPLGKEEITGIQFEPWHFRYVGVDAAEVITKQKITLEEFIENL